MITIDTWAVVAIDDDTISLECPFTPEDGTWTLPTEEIGSRCNVGDILSTETGGWLYLQYDELSDLNDEGLQIFYNYINKKGFHYSFLEKYGFIADS